MRRPTARLPAECWSRRGGCSGVGAAEGAGAACCPCCSPRTALPFCSCSTIGFTASRRILQRAARAPLLFILGGRGLRRLVGVFRLRDGRAAFHVYLEVVVEFQRVNRCQLLVRHLRHLLLLFVSDVEGLFHAFRHDLHTGDGQDVSLFVVNYKSSHTFLPRPRAARRPNRAGKLLSGHSPRCWDSSSRRLYSAW